MNRIVTVLLAFVLVGFVATVSAQDKVAMYPYSVFNKKPLPIGATVWVNVGDDKCTYGNWAMASEAEGFAYPMPSASDSCFKQYHKAKIVAVYSYIWAGNDWSNGTSKFVRVRYWRYRVEIFFPRSPDGDKTPITWTAEFDRLYEIFNLPERWSYSRYFLALNW